MIFVIFFNYVTNLTRNPSFELTMETSLARDLISELDGPGNSLGPWGV